MCGVAGLFDPEGKAQFAPERLERMTNALVHRGPDGAGVWTEQGVGLGHRRLSIIDLLSGQQPMHLPESGSMDAEPRDIPRRGSSGPLHLVFNGEIYNHKELRKKLEKRGHVFASNNSDTEVLLFGYRQWGENLPKHLHGMFAFVIWDQQHRRVFMARDRAGKKPLFIRYSDDQQEVTFASLVGTLSAGLGPGEQAEVNQ